MSNVGDVVHPGEISDDVVAVIDSLGTTWERRTTGWHLSTCRENCVVIDSLALADETVTVAAVQR
jgi:hypothetical protein